MTITIGTRLRDFTVVSSLGAGGMGAVFRAHDSRLGRDVALKVLPEAFVEDESRRARFAREAKALAALSHSGIASIHEFFEHERSMVLVMELVDGETLEEILQRGPLSISKAQAVAIQIAEAIQHAHSRGILHRDLKPSNVKIASDGKVRLLDFGLARVFDVQSFESETQTRTVEGSLTESRAVLGTVPYMSPEQALATATTRGAALLGMEKELGAVAPGYYADLVGVLGNPETDISAVIQRVRWVMKGGVVVVDRTSEAETSR